MKANLAGAAVSVVLALACSSGSGSPDEEGQPSAQGGAGGGSPVDDPVDDDFPVDLAEGPAPTPPMGWNSWNHYACNVRARVIEAMADAMVESGMRDVGYEFVNIDDCWAEVDRAADGSVVVSESFPDGIAALADYVHERDLKLGIYSDRGTLTCAGRAGSEGHETEDADAYASWGVDYLKYDNCNAELDAETQYRTMAAALEATGRPFVYSLCAWEFHEWGVDVGNLWRTTSDIEDTWESMRNNFMNTRYLAAYAGPNRWNDPDMLEIGNGGMTETEYRTHFAMWAIMAAPLIAGNDLTWMDSATLEILANREVIEINQDALGLQGFPVREDDDLSVWAKPLNQAGARAVVLLNLGEEEAEISVDFEEVGLRPGGATVRDLWAHEDLGFFDEGYTATVPPHGNVTLELVGREPRPPSGEVYLSDLAWTYQANGLGPVERDQNNGATRAGDGDPISLQGQVYDKGLGVWGPSKVIYRLGRACGRFTADIGIDDSTNGLGSAVFHVLADGEELFVSDVMTADSAAQTVEVDVTDRQRLELLVTNGWDGAAWDRASWADARLECDESAD